MHDDSQSDKEDTTMNYTKPEVSTLGYATKVIELVNPAKPYQPGTDGTPMHPKASPAYDLDE